MFDQFLSFAQDVDHLRWQSRKGKKMQYGLWKQMDATPKLCCKHIIVKQKGSMLSQESDGGCHALEPKDQNPNAKLKDAQESAPKIKHKEYAH